jgi:threonine/homoserine/homoserine lactone efflux protein
VILASLALGSVVVMTLGAALLFRPTFVQRVADTSKNDGFMRGALSSLFNPTLIATWTLAVGTLNANGWLSKTFGSAAAFALGVALGSLAWFGMLVVITKARRRSVSPAMREKVLRAMGAFLMASGVFLGVRFVMQLMHPGRREQRGIEHAGRLIEDFSHRHSGKH